MGSTTVWTRISPPLSIPWATAAQTLKASSATASSRATICKSTSTNSPLALYWRMVIMVEAGAVADPMAPSSREKGMDSRNTKAMTRKMSTAAVRASNTVRISTFRPFCRSRESRKYFPTPKAMKARATSVTKSIPWTTFWGIRSRR